MNRLCQFSTLPILMISIALLSACDDSSVGVYEEYSVEYTVGIDLESRQGDRPELISFGLIDSYGNHSDFDLLNHLAISPYVNHGYVDIFWDVRRELHASDGHSHIDSFHIGPDDTHNDTSDSPPNYTIDVYINHFDGLIGSQRIFSDYCDSEGDGCYQNPIIFCDYDSDFTMTCLPGDSSLHTNIVNTANIGDLISQIPQRLYIIVDVCDEFAEHCESMSIPVLME